MNPIKENWKLPEHFVALQIREALLLMALKSLEEVVQTYHTAPKIVLHEKLAKIRESQKKIKSYFLKDSAILHSEEKKSF